MRSSPLYLFADKLHWVYLGAVAPFIIALALLSPPNAIPDEWSHFLRAAQMSGGELAGALDRNELGGIVPAWAADVASVQAEKWNGHATPNIERFDGLGDKSSVWAFFPFGVYGPGGYLGSAAGLSLSSVTDASPLQSYYFGRLANAILAIAISGLAIALAKQGKTLLFVLLSLPTTLYLAGSYSQDTCLVAFVALAVALLSRLRDTDWPVATVAGASLLIGLAAAGRLAYAPLLLVPIAASLLFSKNKLASVAATIPGIALACSWIWFQQTAIAETGSQYVHAPYYDPAAQMQLALSGFDHVPKIVVATLSSNGMEYVRQFIGVAFLRLPTWAYFLLVATCIAAATLGYGRYQKEERLYAIVVGVCCILGLGAIAGAMLLMWTRPGSLVIDGIQGRYVLPIAAALCAVFPRKPRGTSTAIASATAGISVVVVIGAISTVMLITRTFP